MQMEYNFKGVVPPKNWNSFTKQFQFTFTSNIRLPTFFKNASTEESNTGFKQHKDQ